MKGIAIIVAVAAVLLAIYYYYLKQLPRTDSGSAPTQAISLTGVRNDLLQIGQAERGSIALNGKCSSLDELISAGALTANRAGRDGYSYQVTCSGASDFQVIAEHPLAASGSGIRYPKMTLDSTLEIHEVH